MLSYFYTKRSIFFNLALICLLVIIWCVAYMQPVLRSFFKDEHLFYGKISYAAMPSIFGGSNIPFMDKTIFKINGDDATFLLYSSQEMNEDMSDWFNFAAVNAADVPLEISAVRINKNTYVVKSMASTFGELDWDTLAEYHVYNSIIGLGIITSSFLAWLIFMILGVRSSRRARKQLAAQSAATTAPAENASADEAHTQA